MNLSRRDFSGTARDHIRKLAELWAGVFEVHPVIPVEEAVKGELEVIAWRDGLKRK